LTRNKTIVPVGAEEEMRGEGRQAVFASVPRLLFTLYTHQPGHEHTRDLISGRPGNPDVHAFVHTLSTEIGFAYCIDLPAPFGLGPAPAHAIALRQGGDPYVVDASSGTLARLDGAKLTVAALGQFEADRSGGLAAAAVSPSGDVLYVAAGPAVRVIDTGTLRTTATWALPAAARGVGLGGDGERLWVGHDGGASALDTTTGRPVASISVPRLTTLVHVAPAGGPFPE
jgi:DNA-binding beta-propeller fold protein YncE